MKARKRRDPHPLNFTPDDKGGRDVIRTRPVPDAKPLRTPPAEGSPPAAAFPSPRRAPDLGLARHAYLGAALATAAWAGMLTAYTLGYVGGWAVLSRAPAELAITGLLAVLPGVFIFAAAFAVRQGARLAAEVRWARSLSQDLITPAALAAARTHDILDAVRQEADRACAATLAAHGQIAAVREGLATETDRLTETAADAQRTARVMSETLGRERETFATLLTALNAGTQGLSDGVERQSRLVADASDLARSQLQEAEATLAAGAAGLAGAGGQVATAAAGAGETLARQAERLDVTAAALSERLRFLDARLSEQRNALSGLAQQLGADDEEMAVRLEARHAQLATAVSDSRDGAEALDRAVDDGASALRGLALAAADHVRDLSDTARAGRSALAEEARHAQVEAEGRLHEGFAALARATDAARMQVEDRTAVSRTAAEEHIALARAQIEQLGQAAFDAGQRANHAFDGRVAEARRMIEQAAALVEEAGQRSADRIAAGVQASRSALDALTGAVSDVDARIASLPQSAGRQVDGVRAAVEQGLGEMTAAARRAADETQAIDQAFQDRIKRNYETLSDAVKLMGKVAGVMDFGRSDPQAQPQPPPAPASEPARAQQARPAPPAPPQPAPAPVDASFATGRWSAPAPTVRTTLQPAQTAPARPTSPAPAAELAPASAGGRAALDEPPSLRPRLKFTPTPADAALKAVFEPMHEPASAKPASPSGAPAAVAAPEGWTWKDLLSSMDEAPTDTDGLGEHMVRQVEDLGLDPAALLPPAQVEELARIHLAGDPSAARDVLRRQAPAAIRRLSRKVLSERELREQADRFVARYHELLRQAADEEGGLRTAMTLLASDAGRAFLLLDAAVGDL